MRNTVGYAIVRTEGTVQRTRDILEGVRFELYDNERDAMFIRDKAFPGFAVVPVTIMEVK